MFDNDYHSALNSVSICGALILFYLFSLNDYHIFYQSTSYVLVRRYMVWISGKNLLLFVQTLFIIHMILFRLGRRCIHNKTHGKKIPGQKTPRIKNTKAKLDIKHYCKIGHKTLSKKHYCKKIRYKSKSKKGDVHNSIIWINFMIIQIASYSKIFTTLIKIESFHFHEQL